MRKLVEFLLLIALISVSQSADRSKYKTCSQSSFCRRNRGIEGVHEVDINSLTVGPYEMSVDLFSPTARDIRFVLTVRAVEVRISDLKYR